MVALLRRNLAMMAPNGPVTVDWGHPLAHGLINLFLPNNPQPRNLAVGHHPEWGGPPYWTWTATNVAFTAGPLGIGCYAAGFDGTLLPSTPYQWTNQNPHRFSCAWLGVVQEFPSSFPYITAAVPESNEGGSTGNAFYFGNRTTLEADRKKAAMRHNTVSIMDAVDTPEMQPTMLVSAHSTAAINFWNNGRYVGAAAGSNYPNVSIGFGGTSTRGVKGWHYGLWTWARTLTGSEAAWLAAEPYAMLTQATRRSTFIFNSVALAAFRGWGIPVK